MNARRSIVTLSTCLFVVVFANVPYHASQEAAAPAPAREPVQGPAVADLPDGNEAQFKEIEGQLDVLLSFPDRLAKADNLASLTKNLETMYEYRREHQGDAWWRTADTRWRLTALRQVASLPAADLEKLTTANLAYKQGEKLFLEARFAEALTLMQRAAADRCGILGPDDKQCLLASTSEARLHLELGAMAKALALFEDARPRLARALGEGHPIYAAALARIASLRQVLSQGQEAEALAATSSDIVRRAMGSDSQQYGEALNGQALVSAALGHVEPAERAYREAIAILDKVDTESGRLSSLAAQNNLGALYAVLVRTAEAEAVFNRIVERANDPRASRWRAMALDNLGGLYFAVGRFREAEARMIAARDLRLTLLGRDHPDYVGSLTNLALLYSELGRDEEADRLLVEALETTRRRPDAKAAIAHITTQLASLYWKMGRYDRVPPLLKEGLEVREAVLGRKSPAFAESLVEACAVAISGSLEDVRDLEVIEKTCSEGLATLKATRGDTHPRVSLALNNLAVVHMKMGRSEEAEAELYEAAQMESKRQGQPRYYATIMTNAAILLSRTGRAEQASDLLIRAIVSRWENMATNFSSMSPRQKRQFLDSTPLFGSHVLWNLVFSGEKVDPRAGLAATYLVKHLLTEAARQESYAFAKAIRAGDEKWRLLWREREMLRRQYASAMLSDLTTGRPRDTDASAAVRPNLDALNQQIERLETELRRSNRVYDQHANVQLIGVKYAVAMLTDRSALIEYVQYRHFDKTSEGLGRARYGAFVVRRGEEGQVVPIDLGDAEPIDRAVQAYRAAMRASIDGFGAIDPSPAMLRASEDAVGEAASALRALVWTKLEPALSGASRVYVAPDGNLSLIPFEALALRDKSGRWQYLAETTELVYLGTARDLARMALPREPRTGPSTAVLIGNPAFSATPAQIAGALPGSLDGPPIGGPLIGGPSIDGPSTLGTMTAGTARYQLPKTWAQSPVLARLLTQARQQLSRLRWQVTLLTNTQATEEAVVGLEAPRLLQLATHGYVLDRAGSHAEVTDGWDNPLLRSMLVFAGANTWTAERATFYRTNGKLLSDRAARAAGLPEAQRAAARVELADGVLTAYEVTGMNLQGTELVNLTACETGLGEVTPDGVIGLRQAFFLAGARALTMSMWEVPAEETTQQVGDFYERWLGRGSGADGTRYTSFRDAQLAALAQARASRGAGHPFYWAGTVYVGDPGDLPRYTPSTP